MTTISPRVRAKVIRRDGQACHYCKRGLKDDEITMDHIMPSSRGGHNGSANLVVACRKCNNRRGDGLPTCECDTCSTWRETQRRFPKAWFDSFSAARP